MHTQNLHEHNTYIFHSCIRHKYKVIIKIIIIIMMMNPKWKTNCCCCVFLFWHKKENKQMKKIVEICQSFLFMTFYKMTMGYFQTFRFHSFKIYFHFNTDRCLFIFFVILSDWAQKWLLIKLGQFGKIQKYFPSLK